MKTDKEKQIVFISRFKSINDLNKWLDDNKDNAIFHKTIYNENDHLLYLYCKVNDPFDEDDIKENMNQLTLNIFILYDICGEIKYSIYSPLWYININDDLFRGPLSTQAICDLYKKKEIDDKTLIRPIELFKPKNKKQDFSLEEIEACHRETFLTDNYEINPIVEQIIKGYKDAVYNKKEKEVIKKYEPENNTNSNTVQIKQKKKYKNKKQKYEVNPTIKVAFSYGQ